MGRRRSVDEELVVSGDRDSWLERCEEALFQAGFKNIVPSPALFQVTAEYRTVKVWGDITIILTPFSATETKIALRSTANVDNVYAIFSDPNATIISEFKAGLDWDSSEQPLDNGSAEDRRTERGRSSRATFPWHWVIFIVLLLIFLIIFVSFGISHRFL